MVAGGAAFSWFFFFLVGTARMRLKEKVAENLLQLGYTHGSIRVHTLGTMKDLNTIPE